MRVKTPGCFARLEAIAEAKAQIEHRAAECFAKEREEYEAKLAERKAKEQRRGKKPRGRPPAPPEPGPKSKDQVNLTDSESRIMPCSGGAFEQTYNAQAAVTTDNMLIVENHVTQQSNDKLQLAPAVQQIDMLPESLGTIDAMLADAGYFSKNNVECCLGSNIAPYIATGRHQHNLSLEERFTEPDPLPGPTDPVSEMKHKLKSKAGKAIYAKRKCTVEPVFGIIKADRLLGRDILVKETPCIRYSELSPIASPV